MNRTESSPKSSGVGVTPVRSVCFMEERSPVKKHLVDIHIVLTSKIQWNSRKSCQVGVSRGLRSFSGRIQQGEKKSCQSRFSREKMWPVRLDSAGSKRSCLVEFSRGVRRSVRYNSAGR